MNPIITCFLPKHFSLPMYLVALKSLCSVLSYLFANILINFSKKMTCTFVILSTPIVVNSYGNSNRFLFKKKYGKISKNRFIFYNVLKNCLCHVPKHRMSRLDKTITTQCMNLIPLPDTGENVTSAKLQSIYTTLSRVHVSLF